MEGLQEFKRRVRRYTEHKVHKIRNSWGIYDGYKYYRKNRPKDKQYVLTESQYFAITRKINNLMAEEIAKGNDFTIPCRMGRIELRKYDTYIKIGKDGEIYDNLPIDWNKTLELWYEDEESYKNKTLVKMEEKEIFTIYYNRNLATYRNQSFYDFKFNRDIKLKLKQRIKDGVIDAPSLERRKINYDK